MQLNLFVLAALVLLAMVCFAEAGPSDLFVKIKAKADADAVADPKGLVPGGDADKEVTQLAKEAGTPKDPNLPPPAPTNPLVYEYSWPPKPQQGAKTAVQHAIDLAAADKYRGYVPAFHHNDFKLPKTTKPLYLLEKVITEEEMKHLRIRQATSYGIQTDDVDDIFSGKF